MDQMMVNLLSILEVVLYTPEEKVVEQGETGSDMYFIQSGDCVLDLIDHSKNEYMFPNILVNGDHFGEIALIYNCNRTCTVTSRFYNTLAKLSYARYRGFINVYPEYNRFLMSHSRRYIDPNKEFFINLLYKINWVR